MFKTVNNGKLPTRGSIYSAGVDVYANEDVVIGAGETAVVRLGIAIDLDWNAIQKQYNSYTETLKNGYRDWFLKSHYISLKPRSSLRAKGLISHSAIIDLDFKDEIKMIIYNPSNPEWNTDDCRYVFDLWEGKQYEIKKGDKIGQLLLMEHKGYLFGIESDEERIGGIGSTGK